MPKIKKRLVKPPAFNNKPNITIGADPELFLYNKASLSFVSGHPYFGDHNKWNPLPVPRGAIQIDGVAAEFNISPAKTRKEFITNINHVSRLLAKYIANQNKDIELVAAPTAYFNQVYFDSLPDHVRTLGCNPDYSAYTMEANEKPETDKPMRTSSGHIHVGWMDTELKNEMAEEHFLDCCHLVRKLDWLLYNSSKLWDQNEERRELYGKPGAFRPKKYGLEYRVLSSAWLNDTRTKMFVYDAAKAISSMHLSNTPIDVSVSPEADGMEKYLASVSKQHLPNIKSYIS